MENTGNIDSLLEDLYDVGYGERIEVTLVYLVFIWVESPEAFKEYRHTQKVLHQGSFEMVCYYPPQRKNNKKDAISKYFIDCLALGKCKISYKSDIGNVMDVDKIKSDFSTIRDKIDHKETKSFASFCNSYFKDYFYPLAPDNEYSQVKLAAELVFGKKILNDFNRVGGGSPITLKRGRNFEGYIIY